MNSFQRIVRLLLLLAAISIPFPVAHAQGTAFTYQGRLNDGAGLASGIYDLRFAIYDSSGGGAQQGALLTNSTTAVSNGLFTVALDFGNQFPGANRWLEVGVRTNGGGAFDTLTPRQKITATPYAIQAANAATATIASSASSVAAANITGTILNSSLPANPNFSGAVTATSFSGSGAGLTGINAGNLSSGTVPLARLGGITSNQLDATTWQLATNLNNGNAATLEGLKAAGFWKTSGNTNTTAGTNFLGTTDDEPLELKVNNRRALRLEPLPNSNFNSNIVNVIGGSSANHVVPGVYGATIAGGGALYYSDTATSNTVAADFGTIGGGYKNRIHIYSVDSTIAGGHNNVIETNSNSSTISGGYTNKILSFSSGATIGGGIFHAIQTNSDHSTIGGGYFNFIADNNDRVTIAGGGANKIQEYARASTIGGGEVNYIERNAYNSTISGGSDNAIRVYSYYSTVAGGLYNIIQDGAAYSTIGGGALNTVQDSARYAVIAGGNNNVIKSGAILFSTIGGGNKNTNNAPNSTIPGGSENYTSGQYSFAAGRRAKATNDGSFVWADSSPADFTSTGNDEFDVRASGGVNFDNDTSLFFGSNIRQMLNLYGTAYGIGVQGSTLYQRSNARFAWYVGGTHNNNATNSGGGNTLMMLSSAGLTVNGTFVSASDRNVKENFSPVDSRDILARVAALPLTQWNYKADTDTRHLGPMAQDFYAAFGIGPDDKHITMVDADGVALAAIQGLNQKVEEKDARIAELEKRLEKLEQLLNTKTEGTK